MVLPAAFGSEVSAWWVVALLITAVLAVAASAFLGLGAGKAQRADGASCRGPDDHDDRPLHEEPWVPKLETRDWAQAAEFPDCPWAFDGCDDVQDALECIWSAPLCSDMQTALSALKAQVKSIQIARVTVPWPREVHYVAVYKLGSGAELFGGRPLSVAGDAGRGSTDPGVCGSELRQRRSRSSRSSGAGDMVLPCLLPFYRIHDGFGVLLSTRHLPMVVAGPQDHVEGSCYYVYPSGALERDRRCPQLTRFARIDKNCSACADHRLQQPTVIYVEDAADPCRDDELLLPFVADTICNFTGQRVVPPSYMLAVDSEISTGE